MKEAARSCGELKLVFYNFTRIVYHDCSLCLFVIGFCFKADIPTTCDSLEC